MNHETIAGRRNSHLQAGGSSAVRVVPHRVHRRLRLCHFRIHEAPGIAWRSKERENKRWRKPLIYGPRNETRTVRSKANPRIIGRRFSFPNDWNSLASVRRFLWFVRVGEGRRGGDEARAKSGFGFSNLLNVEGWERKVEMKTSASERWTEAWFGLYFRINYERWVNLLVIENARIANNLLVFWHHRRQVGFDQGADLRMNYMHGGICWNRPISFELIVRISIWS